MFSSISTFPWMSFTTTSTWAMVLSQEKVMEVSSQVTRGMGAPLLGLPIHPPPTSPHCNTTSPELAYMAIGSNNSHVKKINFAFILHSTNIIHKQAKLCILFHCNIKNHTHFLRIFTHLIYFFELMYKKVKRRMRRKCVEIIILVWM